MFELQGESSPTLGELAAQLGVSVMQGLPATTVKPVLRASPMRPSKRARCVTHAASKVDKQAMKSPLEGSQEGRATDIWLGR